MEHSDGSLPGRPKKNYYVFDLQLILEQVFTGYYMLIHYRKLLKKKFYFKGVFKRVFLDFLRFMC